MERGVVVLPMVFETRGTVFELKRSMSPQELRYFTMYWDKLVVPDSRIIGMKLPDQDVLVETGIMSRPLGKLPNFVDSSQIGALMLEAQAQIAESLIKNEPETDWVIHQIGSNIAVPLQFSVEKRIIRVELQQALPVPFEDVPIVDILDFKARRSDELLALHQYLDEAYMEVLKSPDPDLERKVAVARLRKSISDLDTVTRERWKVTKKVDFSAELNLDGAKIAAGVAAGAAFNFYTPGMSIPLGPIVGGLISMVKISAKTSATFEPAKNNFKLGYLSHAQKEQLLPSSPKDNLEKTRWLSDSAVSNVSRKLAEMFKKGT